MAPGQTAVLNGTVQEVYAQILDINPGYQLAAAGPPPASSTSTRLWNTSAASAENPRRPGARKVRPGQLLVERGPSGGATI